MNPRAVIGITTQNLRTIRGIPGLVPDSWMMSQRFIRAVAAAGGIPWMIPLLDGDTDTLRLTYERIDGVMIPGGADIDPDSYGAERHPLTEGTDPPRDSVEHQLVEWALADGMPVLGLCRGFQVINLVLGGTMYQDVAEEHPGAIKHDYVPSQGYARDRLSHDIEIVARSRLAQILAATTRPVNSMHHQGVRDLGSGLLATARAPDGLVEALELPAHPFMLGVQWHPEALCPSDAAMRRLFEEFIAAAARHEKSR